MRTQIQKHIKNCVSFFTFSGDGWRRRKCMWTTMMSTTTTGNGWRRRWRKGSADLSPLTISTKWMLCIHFSNETIKCINISTKEFLFIKSDLFRWFCDMLMNTSNFSHCSFCVILLPISSSFSFSVAALNLQKPAVFLSIKFKKNFRMWSRKRKRNNHLPLLQTLLSSSSGPLESLSSSCRCKWLCWLKWWWFRPKLWCKWCRWLLLLLAADALKSRGLSGDGERPPFSTRSRLKWSAAPTLAAPPPPRISVIIKRDRDGSTAIDPRCIGTVIVKPLAAAATPFGVKKLAALVIVDDFGLSPVECHCSTILIELSGIGHN